MSVLVTPSVSANGLLTLDVNVVSPTGKALRFINIWCGAELMAQVMPRIRVVADGNGRLYETWTLIEPSARHLARIPLSAYPNGDLIFSVSAHYVEAANVNTAITGTEVSSDSTVANTWSQPSIVLGPTIFPVGAIVAPITLTFDAPATCDTADIPLTVAAVDDNAVTGYLVNESATPPLASAPGWTTTAPTSYTVATSGAHTLYAWAKDADGNVSDPVTAAVTATFAATTAPELVVDSATITPSISGANLVGVMAADNASITPVASAVALVGTLPVDSASITPAISAAELTEAVFTGAGSIRSPSGAPLNLRSTNGQPLTIRRYTNGAWQ